MMDVMTALSATPVAIARSDSFIPVDTEALDPDTQALFAGWMDTHQLDALISTDGDADRPMLVTACGQVVPGDVLGALTAKTLGAEVICTPVSSNTQVDTLFPQVIRTRIGSPYVIDAMERAGGKVAGYEANGGFLLGFNAQGLAPLMTRDSLLPIIAPLSAAQRAGKPLSDLIAKLPPRFTAANRLQGIAANISQAFLAELTETPWARTAATAISLCWDGRATFSEGLLEKFVLHAQPGKHLL